MDRFVPRGPAGVQPRGEAAAARACSPGAAGLISPREQPSLEESVPIQSQQSFYPDAGRQVAPESAAERSKFIERTYLHLAGAIGAFVALEFAFFKFLPVVDITRWMISSPFNWGIVLVLFLITSWGADYFARHSTSRPMQYLGLGLYVLVEAVIFIPMLLLAQAFSGPDNPIIMTAGVSTLAIFAALTGIVLVTKKDFGWMAPALAILSMGALVLVVLAMIFGWSLGIGFTVFMIMLAAGYILYDTSNVLRVYHPTQYVAASLALFASVALMFWYILRLMIQLAASSQE
jgi:FtsH-binding integral membrane protein